MKLLIVNDEILTTETMKQDMPWSSYGISHVYTAYNVKDAKSIIKNTSIDLILCDIEMPKETGLDLLEWIRNQKLDIELIFLTCHANFGYAQKAIELGCQNYILIPAKYDKIGAEILKVVNRINEKRHLLKMQEYGKKLYYDQMASVIEKNEGVSPEVIVNKAISYILENISSFSLSVNSVADFLFVHPVYLNRIFKKQKHITVGQYIIGERMRMAAELMESQRLNLYSISEAVGYTCYTSFNVIFRKYYGCSPKQYFEKMHDSDINDIIKNDKNV